MKLRVFGAAALVAVLGAGLIGVAKPEMVYAECTCPAGSERNGDPCTTLAECNFPKKDDEEGLMTVVVRILNVVVGVVGVVAVAVIIIGGIFFVISQGDPSKIARAKNTILYGLVGLVISLLAFAIVNFVLSNVFKSSGVPKKTKDGESSEVTEP